jgi:hypothetical protein
MQHPKYRALAALIVGTLSLCICWFFWVPVFGIFICLLAIILALTAIILGKKSKKLFIQNQENSKKIYFQNANAGFYSGITGLIISVICFVLAFLFTFYFKILV